MKGDLISRKALKETLRQYFPVECMDGISSVAMFNQILTDIDNAPTVDMREDTKTTTRCDKCMHDFHGLCDCPTCMFEEKKGNAMRLIGAEALKKAIKDNGYSHYFEILDIIDNAPTVESVKQCKYCKHCGDEDYCSNCHEYSLFEHYERGGEAK